MKNKHLHRALTLLFAGMMSTSFIAGALTANAAPAGNASTPTAQQESIRELNNDLFDSKELTKQYLDDSVAYQLPETVKNDDVISIIVKMNTSENLLDAYEATNSQDTLAEYLPTRKARRVASSIESDRSAFIKKLNAASISYTLGVSYDVLFSGFEINILPTLDCARRRTQFPVPLLYPFQKFFKFSCKERPDGSLPPFG